jgi:hypothetical protein
MTLHQLHNLSEDEVDFILYVFNVIDPVTSPKMEILRPQQLVSIRHEVLVQRLLNTVPKLKLEYHSFFISLMEKLGVKVEIKQSPQPEQPISSSNVS